LYLVGILFPHINDDPRSKPHQIPFLCLFLVFMGSTTVFIILFYCLTSKILGAHMHIYGRVTGIDFPTAENSCLSRTQHSRYLSILLLRVGKRPSIWNNSFFNTNSG